jgi:hypothetical protein
MVVIAQPDGSLACLPAWMLEESAARYTIRDANWHFTTANARIKLRHLYPSI